MSVYCIRAGLSGPVKLGHGHDPEKRLADLQVAHWEELFLIRVWKGGEAEERTLHARFADLRLRGEWFSFSRAMLGDVGLTIVPEEVKSEIDSVVTLDLMADAVELGNRLRNARKYHGLTQQQVSDRIDMRRSSLASVEAGHDFPGRVMLLRLCDLYGLSFADIQTPVAA